MSMPSAEDLSFRYVAIDRGGRQVKDTVRARDSRAAARALIAEGLTPVTVTQELARARGTKDRELTARERVGVLRQLALMVEAGVGLLEAMQTVAQGIVAAKGRQKFEAVITALKRGDSLAHAMEAHAPGFPFYVYAMLRVGEATGQVGEVLAEAAAQMEYEERLKREVTTSLFYPAFLIAAGVAVVAFMMLYAVPRFATMVGDKREAMHPLSKAVFGLSDFLTQNWFFVAAGAVLAAVGIIAAFTQPAVKARAYAVLRQTVLIGPILRARELNAWSRLLGFSLANGVGLLEAASLARRGAPAGKFRQGLEQFERDLKGGVDVAESLSRHTELTGMDLSLLRAGAKSGSLPKMVLYVADGYDATLREGLKRLTAFIQPIAILVIAIIVAVLAIAIVLAMVSINQTIII
jgi:general secretion pathway protein F